MATAYRKPENYRNPSTYPGGTGAPTTPGKSTTAIVTVNSTTGRG